MSKYASGKFALRISDRDGQAYPYNEMVQEWTGMWVHQSEYEPKSPLLDPKNHPVDYEALEHSKGQVVSVTIPIGGIYINDDATSTSMTGGGTNGVSPAIGANSFQTVLQTIQQFNPIPAPGAYETVQVRTMQPLNGSSQANQDTIMNTQLGIVTVAIS
tara:strand:- start:329 stop:805 length:477 start_codon:yes stop_codon:yes gene_type:complete